jgi:hypothetical protein
VLQSLSPIGDSSGIAIIGSTRGGTPCPLRALIEDSIEEFHIASDVEGRTDLPFPQRHSTGPSTPPPPPLATILWSETTPTTHALMTIPPLQAAPRHKPLLGEERILMIDYTPIQAWGRGDAPTISHEGAR